MNRLRTQERTIPLFKWKADITFGRKYDVDGEKNGPCAEPIRTLYRIKQPGSETLQAEAITTRKPTF